MAAQEPFLNIILLGKTGNGKSSSGNSILGREAFNTSSGTESLTKCCTLESTIRDGTQINIVDTPGLIDTGNIIPITLSEINQGMSLCSAGFHAIIFVVKFGNRFTDEEQKVFEILKQYFGQDILKKFGIIIISQGDSFYLNNKENLTFKQWLAITKSKENESAQVKLFDECEDRCVLFYNSGAMFEKNKEESVSELLELIRKIPEPYTSEQFKEADGQRKELFKKINAPAVCAKIQENLSLLMDQLHKDLQNNSFSFDNMNRRFRNLDNELDKLNSDSMEFKIFKSQIKVLQESLEKMKNDQLCLEMQKEQQTQMLEKIQELKNPPGIGAVIGAFFLAGLSSIGATLGTVLSLGLAKNVLQKLEEKAYEYLLQVIDDFIKSSVDCKKDY